MPYYLVSCGECLAAPTRGVSGGSCRFDSNAPAVPEAEQPAICPPEPIHSFYLSIMATSELPKDYTHGEGQIHALITINYLIHDLRSHLLPMRIIRSPLYSLFLDAGFHTGIYTDSFFVLTALAVLTLSSFVLALVIHGLIHRPPTPAFLQFPAVLFHSLASV